VRCEARVISQGRRIITCESKVTDSTGRILAHGTSTLMVLDRPAQS
jgi:acyl-coenzyme A thioesterase PaaI-like protein